MTDREKIDKLLSLLNSQIVALLEDRKSAWISVREKLPPVDEDVLVAAVSKVGGETRIAITYMIDRLYFGGGPIMLRNGPKWHEPWQYFLTDYEITHWMPLPSTEGLNET